MKSYFFIFFVGITTTCYGMNTRECYPHILVQEKHIDQFYRENSALFTETTQHSSRDRIVMLSSKVARFFKRKTIADELKKHFDAKNQQANRAFRRKSISYSGLLLSNQNKKSYHDQFEKYTYRYAVNFFNACLDELGIGLDEE